LSKAIIIFALLLSSPFFCIAATASTATSTPTTPNSDFNVLQNLEKLPATQATAASAVPPTGSSDTLSVHAASEQSDAITQFNIGYTYESGSGGAKNYVEAARWYRKAARQGYARAQFNLGFYYDQGLGIAQDYEQAYFWWSLAAKSGDQTYIARRDELEKLLTDEEIAAARQRAAVWQPTPARSP
jgi:TPR repeat protein